MSAQAVNVSPFPQPPEYARNYTDANIKNKAVLPPPNIPNQYTVFGEDYDIHEEMIRSLQSQKMQQLFSNTGDWRSELKKLNRSTIACFLDLLEILVRCPNNPERLEKINNLRLLFINMHHLINEYRPLQARDTLQIIMRNQIKSVQEVTERFREYLRRANDLLDQCLEELAPAAAVEGDSEEMTTQLDSHGNSVDMLNVQGGGYDEARRSAAYKRRAYSWDIAICNMLDADAFNDTSSGTSRTVKMEH